MFNAVVALFFFIGLLISLLSPLLLICPRRLGVVHRIYALPVSFAFAVSIAIVSLAFPQWDHNGSMSGNRLAGLLMLAIWAIPILIAWLVVRSSKDEHIRRGLWRGLYNHWIKSDPIYDAYRERLKAAKAQRLQTRESRATARKHEKQAQIAAQAHLEAEKQRRRHDEAARAAVDRAEREKYRQQVAQAQREAAHKRLLDQAEEEGRATQRRIDSGPSAASWMNTDDRLSDMFENYRAGLATLDEYEDAVKAEAEAIKERSAELREERKLYGEDYYEMQKEQLDEDRDAVQWRKRWLSDERHRAKNSRPGFAPSGKWSRFEYVDADGVITKRHVVNWERRGAYIVGFDKNCQEERTFRQDRISDWLAG